MTITEIVIDLAKKYPNALYTRSPLHYVCCNTKGKVLDGPETEGCIVGQAIVLSDNQELKKVIQKHPTAGVRWLYQKEFLPKSENITFLSNVQARQDIGHTWGDAVRLSLDDLQDQKSHTKSWAIPD